MNRCGQAPHHTFVPKIDLKKGVVMNVIWIRATYEASINIAHRVGIPQLAALFAKQRIAKLKLRGQR